MLRLIDKKSKLFFYLILFILLSTQITKNKNTKENFITNLKNIEIVGLSDENNYKIYESLKFLLTKNIFFVNKEDVENILNNNHLVESFFIKKIYPNLIRVQIKQTNLLAITSQNNKKFYIGSNGKLISMNQIKDFDNTLPFVYSKSNYIDFIKLKKIIDESEFQFEQIESFYYFPSNRWDIKTNDDLLIKLPHKNLSKALKIAHLIKKNKEFKNNKILDLRIANHIITTNE